MPLNTLGTDYSSSKKALAAARPRFLVDEVAAAGAGAASKPLAALMKPSMETGFGGGGGGGAVT